MIAGVSRDTRRDRERASRRRPPARFDTFDYENTTGLVLV